MSVIVMTDEHGRDYYFYEGKPIVLGDLPKHTISKRKYATVLDAIKDSEQYKNPHYSDGECLDYVLDVIQQLERE